MVNFMDIYWTSRVILSLDTSKEVSAPNLFIPFMAAAGPYPAAVSRPGFI